MKENFIGKRVATLRLAKGISARALSMELGQSENYINHIENGRSEPSMEGLRNICDYFEISLADFFDDKNEYSQKVGQCPSFFYWLIENFFSLVIDNVLDAIFKNIPLWVVGIIEEESLMLSQCCGRKYYKIFKTTFLIR